MAELLLQLKVVMKERDNVLDKVKKLTAENNDLRMWLLRMTSRQRREVKRQLHYQYQLSKISFESVRFILSMSSFN